MAIAKNKYKIIKVKTSDGRYIRKWKNVETGKTYFNKPPDAGTGVSKLGLTRGETKALKGRQAKGNLINKYKTKPTRRGNTNTGLGDIRKHQKKVSDFVRENRTELQPRDWRDGYGAQQTIPSSGDPKTWPKRKTKDNGAGKGTGTGTDTSSSKVTPQVGGADKNVNAVNPVKRLLRNRQPPQTQRAEFAPGARDFRGRNISDIKGFNPETGMIDRGPINAFGLEVPQQSISVTPEYLGGRNFSNVKTLGQAYQLKGTSPMFTKGPVGNALDLHIMKLSQQQAQAQAQAQVQAQAQAQADVSTALAPQQQLQTNPASELAISSAVPKFGNPNLITRSPLVANKLGQLNTAATGLTIAAPATSMVSLGGPVAGSGLFGVPT